MERSGRDLPPATQTGGAATKRGHERGQPRAGAAARPLAHPGGDHARGGRRGPKRYTEMRQSHPGSEPRMRPGYDCRLKGFAIRRTFGYGGLGIMRWSIKVNTRRLGNLNIEHRGRTSCRTGSRVM